MGHHKVEDIAGVRHVIAKQERQNELLKETNNRHKSYSLRITSRQRATQPLTGADLASLVHIARLEAEFGYNRAGSLARDASAAQFGCWAACSTSKRL